MSEEGYTFCLLKDDIIYITSEFKEKKGDYGIVMLSVELIDILQDIIQLLSRDSLLSPKSSVRIEKFLIPRFDEIMGIIHTNKTLPPKIGIEISKESVKDIIKGLTYSGVIAKLDDRDISSEELKNILEKVKFSK
ncbi:MAG: hypothetical protein ACFE9I_07385 [Candidatus Hermodarchaeota archaeon]